MESIHKSLVVKEFAFIDGINTTYQKVSSAIDLDSEALKHSLGALLNFMQSSIFHLDNGKVIVSSIKMIPMENIMKIDGASFKALQIFAEESHPNVLKGVGRSKAISKFNPLIQQ